MKNTVQKYLFYPEQQNTRHKKYALQHTLTTKAKYSMWLTNHTLNTKKCRNDSASAFYIHLILHLIHFTRLYPYTANSPNSSSIRSNWLYFAIRSERLNEPVFIWPLLVATAISAMVASSVSPER